MGRVTFGTEADNEYGVAVPKGAPLQIRLGKWDPEAAGQDPAVFDAKGRFLGSPPSRAELHTRGILGEG